jgi:hypothetical protein
LKKNEDLIQTGTDYEHQKANDYLTRQRKNSKELLYNNKNYCSQTFLKGLTPTESTDYSLWKATKNLKQAKNPSPPLSTSPKTWTISNVEKSHIFAEHLATVFQSHHSEHEPEEEPLIQRMETPYQLEPPINRLKRA